MITRRVVIFVYIALAFLAVTARLLAIDKVNADQASIAAGVWIVAGILYWRGLDWSRFVLISSTSVFLGIFLPEPFITTSAPAIIMMPLILAALIGDRWWIVIAFFLEISILLMRANFTGIYIHPVTVLILGIMMIGLELKRYLHDQSLDQLRSISNQHTLMFEMIDDIVFMVHVEPHDVYRYIDMNPAGLELLGVSYPDIVGHLVDDVIPEPSLTVAKTNYRLAIDAKGVVRWEDETTYLTRTIYAEVSVVPIINSFGRVTQLLGSIHDITERVESQKGTPRART